MNFCAACNLDFGSVSAFDAHCVGKHAYTYSEGIAMEPMREDGRRCLRVDEMEAAGWHLDSRGRWRAKDASLSLTQSRRGDETRQAA